MKNNIAQLLYSDDIDNVKLAYLLSHSIDIALFRSVSPRNGNGDGYGDGNGDGYGYF